MPDLKEVIDRLEMEVEALRRPNFGSGYPERYRLQVGGKIEGLEHALSALKPLLEKTKIPLDPKAHTG